MRLNSLTIQSVSRPLIILGILILISALAGCINSESKQGEEVSALNVSPSLNASEENSTLVKDALTKNSTKINESEPNQIRVHVLSKEYNSTGKLPVILQIKNPKLNATVLTIFKPQFGQEWYNQTNISYTLKNRNWLQNFSIRPKGNTSYVWMYVQITDNNTMLNRAAWNITFEVPVGKAT